MSIPSPYEENINEVRVIVLFEIEPFSSKYKQISLSQEQYKEVTALLETFMEHRKGGGFWVRTEDEVMTLPSELRPFNVRTNGKSNMRGGFA